MKHLTARSTAAGEWPRAVTIAKMRPSRRVLRSALKLGPGFSPAAMRASAARVSSRKLSRCGESSKLRNASRHLPPGAR